MTIHRNLTTACTLPNSSVTSILQSASTGRPCCNSSATRSRAICLASSRASSKQENSEPSGSAISAHHNVEEVKHTENPSNLILCLYGFAQSLLCCTIGNDLGGPEVSSLINGGRVTSCPWPTIGM